MGFSDFFKKEMECERCHQVVLKKKICRCEMESASSMPLKESGLCRSCLAVTVRQALSRYRGRIVAVHPMAKYAGYHLYRFAEMPTFEYNASFITALRNVLPVSDVVCSCGQISQVVWCPPELVDNGPLSDSDHVSPCEKRFLCLSCFSDELVGRLSDENSPVFEVIMPAEGDGFFTPMEAIFR